MSVSVIIVMGVVSLGLLVLFVDVFGLVYIWKFVGVE